jgi:outer membrane lipoprotein-sorting protein
MTFFRRNVFVALIAVLMLGSGIRSAFAAEDLAGVLAKLDAASTKFKSAQADLTTDIVQTQPLPDEDKQTGTVLFQRKDGQLQMALHLKTDNGKPVLKDLVFAGGVLKLYEPRLKQMQIFKAGANRAQADTILTVGFGGSGKDLQKTWDVSYAGSEQVEGKNTAKLELVPKDAGVKNTFPKVMLWVDMENGIAVKQQFFDPSGNYKLAIYRNVRLNGSVPGDAFEIKTASGTQVINH